MALNDLESMVEVIGQWAKARSIPADDGILELGDSLPRVTVVAFAPEDVELFLKLAGTLQAAVVVVNAAPLTTEDLTLVKTLVENQGSNEQKRYFTKVIADAKKHLGRVHHLDAYAFAPGLERVVVLRAATEWGAPLFELSSLLEAGDEMDLR
ncbi:MAG: hypothetical protein ABI765_04625 [Gemmatimonadota bacterium]